MRRRVRALLRVDPDSSEHSGLQLEEPPRELPDLSVLGDTQPFNGFLIPFIELSQWDSHRDLSIHHSIIDLMIARGHSRI